MKVATPLYEGDGFIHAAPTSFGAFKQKSVAPRVQAIADLFGRLFRAIEHWAWRARQKDLEDYLAHATDHYDLERRIQAVDRARHSTFG